MSDGRILVIHGSWAGSTANIADNIAGELRAQGFVADVRAAQDVTDLSGYTAAIVGSGIRSGKLHPSVESILTEKGQALRQIPVGCFVACLAMRHGEKAIPGTDKYVQQFVELTDDLRPLAVGRFAGVMDYSRLSEQDSAALKSYGTPEGDFREPGAERAWARHFVSLLPG